MATRLQLYRTTGPAQAEDEAARAYDAAGGNYLSYADGDPDRLFDFSGRYSFADREIWDRLDVALHTLRASGRRDITILDAGCGPGTWLRRIIARALELGFTHINARGFDISAEMIALAKNGPQHWSKGVNVAFDCADITHRLPESDDSIDLALCLYGVLNHLPVTAHDAVAAELTRVTRGTLFLTVRTIGSMPTIYVDAIERACCFHQDHDADRLHFDLVDGKSMSFTSHLFSSTELRALFRAHARVADIVGLDVFHSRFAPNPHWNPTALPYSRAFEHELAKLEHSWASDPAFIDRAAHILLSADCASEAG